MLVLRSALFNVLFIGWTVFLLSTLWILLPFSRDVFRSGISLWPRGIFPLMQYILGLTFEERGLIKRPNKPVIFAVKHQSTWDTMYFLWMDKNNCYVMKEELNQIPFWKWYMSKCDHVMVDRRGGISAMRKMIRDTRVILDSGRSIIIFPEGTRTPPGQKQTYHPGVAALYAKSNATVVPVALNSGVFWGRRQFLKKPGVLTIEYLPPMPEGMGKKVFLAELESRIENATRKLEQEALVKLSTNK